MPSEYIESYQPDYLHQDMPLAVYFVRHGQPDTKTKGAALGPGLSTLGKRQASRVAKRLSKERFTHIYSSDLTRAFETAKAVTGYHENIPFTVESDLREVLNYHFLPDFSGMERQFDPDSVCAEKDAMTRFVNRLRHAHGAGERVAVVCHGNLIRTLIPMLAGRNPRDAVLMDMHHTSVSMVEVWQSGEAILKLANCTKHLLPKQVT